MAVSKGIQGLHRFGLAAQGILGLGANQYKADPPGMQIQAAFCALESFFSGAPPEIDRRQRTKCIAMFRIRI